MNNRQYRTVLEPLYTKQGFDRTITYYHSDGVSYLGCPCWYCGNVATSKDHAYPLIALLQLLAVGEKPPQRLLVIVPSCQECNGMLSDKVFASLANRKRYLKQRLKRRYHNVLQLPAWSDSDMAELDYALREYVRLAIAQQDQLRKRLEW